MSDELPNTEEREVDDRPSIMFWVLLASAALYLLMRFGEGVVWLIERLR